MQVSRIDFNSKNASQLFDQSLRNTGFAVIENHLISYSEISQTYAEWTRFFSNDAKYDYLFQPTTQAGYFPFKSENAKDSKVKDLKEFFHIFPSTLLPNGVDAITKLIQRKLIDTAKVLLGWLQIELPETIRQSLSMPLPDMITDSQSTLFRIIHYPPLGTELETGAVRAAAHEDINLLTLLPAATSPGLQVKSLDGSWFDVPCDPGSLVVNSGDMLHLATGGYYPSTTHRVMNPPKNEASRSRYSMPLFLHPRGEVPLSKQVTAHTYLNQRLRELGLIQ